MILSRRHRFVFIKGLKVGGTSVEIALAAICGPEDIVSPILPIDELRRLESSAGARNYSSNRAGELAYQTILRQTAVSDLAEFPMPPAVYFNHMPLRDILELQGRGLLEYKILAVERCPYAKIISWANHKLSSESYKVGGEMLSNRGELKNYLHQAVKNRSILAVKNIDRYCLPDGSIPAKIMRFENLASELQKFVRSLGVNCCPDLPHVKKGILANNLDPRDFFSGEQISIINELFLEEFQIFNYEAL